MKTRRYLEDNPMQLREKLYPSSEWCHVKAFIRYSSHDRKEVVYFKRRGRTVKLLDGGTLKVLSSKVSFNHWLRNNSWGVKTTPVFEDEQVLYNGKPLDLTMDSQPVSKSLIEKLLKQLAQN